MTDQFELFPNMSQIERAFRLFVRENPDVVMMCVLFLRQAQSAGVEKVGMGEIFERLRWDHKVDRRRRERFKLNNNYRSYMTRLIKQTYPGEFDTLIDTRKLRAEEPVFTDEPETPTSPIEGHIAPGRDMDGEDDPPEGNPLRPAQ